MQTYRTSKNQFYETPPDCCAVDESVCLRLSFINDQLSHVSKKLLENHELQMMNLYGYSKPQAIYDLGCVPNSDVLDSILNLDGYHALHKSLKILNADFRFQILPSAGMVRPNPSLLLIVETYRNYASNVCSKNKHMYPGFSAKDNITRPCRGKVAFNFS